MAEFCKMCGDFRTGSSSLLGIVAEVTRVSNLKLGRMHILNGG